MPRPSVSRAARLAPLAFACLPFAAGCAADEPPPDEDAETSTDELFEAPPLGPDPAGAPVKHPIVLAHGFNASPTNGWAFYGVRDALLADGHPVVVEASVPPFASPWVRSGALARHVDAARATCARTPRCDPSRVNVVAHSMGGLDARSLVSRRGYGDRVASITTISTPHRGSAVADVALAALPGKLDDAVSALARAYATTFTTKDLADDTDLRAAFEALAEKNAKAFAALHPDDPRVYYQSWAGVSSVGGIRNPKDEAACGGPVATYRKRADVMDAQLVPMAAFVAHGLELRPNDGMATVESAKWGNFRGCIAADHLDEVGQPRHDGRSFKTGFEHRRFYRNLAFDLAKRGF